ncbi:MAG: hypothetical protein KDA27_15775 [Candidatus Eisenbacteria bacterium]|uniref:Copper-binding protein MbnP-like domain-containing protein n=1 Tax=Eiseniibacteriota bacterium TaxID=2212470 RepID=A0A956SE85_UNCEI|nr:hypothetical protein [Candidatus Eisenbacteria bacterium]
MPSHLRMQLPLTAVVAAFLFVSGCDDDNNPVVPPPSTGTIMIDVEHKVGAADLELGTVQYTNAFGNVYGVYNLEYFLSDFFVMNEDGRQEVNGAHYVRASDETTHTIVVEGVPVGHYHMLGFTFGLDDEDNVTGALSGQSQEVDNMFWPENWGGGYHYMKLEGRFINSEQTESGFATHAGRFRAEGRDESHFVEESLTLHQNVNAGETLHLTLVVDVNKWYEGPNTIDLVTHNAIMNNYDRQVELEQNCSDVFTLLGGGSH